MNRKLIYTFGGVYWGSKQNVAALFPVHYINMLLNKEGD